ncbi:MAG: glutamine amidotransferase [Actinomycetota bacterium]
MCGIIGLHLKDPELYDQLGSLMAEMMKGIVVRGPDSAGVAIYGDRERCPQGHSIISLLNAPVDVAEAVAKQLPNVDQVAVEQVGETTVLTAEVTTEELSAAVAAAAPQSVAVGLGEDMVVYKGVGHPTDLAETYRLRSASGWQGIAHTRLATESAVDAEGCHPFSVGTGVGLVHNGSFSNHASIRRELQSSGVSFDSMNDTEVGARFVASCLAEGDDLEAALIALGERFDGFYTLLVTTENGFAVVRDEFACKPAIVAEHPQWVAMASEFQALAPLPGIDQAHVFEPEPGRVYAWKR